jgi:hypothetical protein
VVSYLELRIDPCREGLGLSELCLAVGVRCSVHWFRQTNEDTLRPKSTASASQLHKSHKQPPLCKLEGWRVGQHRWDRAPNVGTGRDMDNITFRQFTHADVPRLKEITANIWSGR